MDINLAIKGVAIANLDSPRHFISAATEHKAVLDCFEWLRNHGHESTILPVNTNGLVSLDELRNAIQNNTVLISIMAANNEIGVLQPIEAIGQICRDRGIYFMTDATQALGKIPIDVQGQRIDLLAASAHKIYGPKGIGLLYVRRSNPKVQLVAQIDGGGHERGLRSGTLPTPQIVGFGKAVEIAIREHKTEVARILALRDKLEAQIRNSIPEAILNGDRERRLPSNLNFSFKGVDAEALITSLHDKLALSSGSACTSARITPSHVLRAIGLTEEQARSSVRISLGKYTTHEEIDAAAILLKNAYQRIKSLSNL